MNTATLPTEVDFVNETLKESPSLYVAPLMAVLEADVKVRDGAMEHVDPVYPE
jgi:hypothetical protein